MQPTDVKNNKPKIGVPKKPCVDKTGLNANKLDESGLIGICDEQARIRGGNWEQVRMNMCSSCGALTNFPIFLFGSFSLQQTEDLTVRSVFVHLFAEVRLLKHVVGVQEGPKLFPKGTFQYLLHLEHS